MLRFKLSRRFFISFQLFLSVTTWNVSLILAATSSLRRFSASYPIVIVKKYSFIFSNSSVYLSTFIWSSLEKWEIITLPPIALIVITLLFFALSSYLWLIAFVYYSYFISSVFSALYSVPYFHHLIFLDHLISHFVIWIASFFWITISSSVSLSMSLSSRFHLAHNVIIVINPSYFPSLISTYATAFWILLQLFSLSAWKSRIPISLFSRGPRRCP